jgi:hypothetical protein
MARAEPHYYSNGSDASLNINKDEFAEGKLTSNITVGAGPSFIPSFSEIKESAGA